VAAASSAAAAAKARIRIVGKPFLSVGRYSIVPASGGKQQLALPRGGS